MSKLIEDYALLGDGETAALLARTARSIGCAGRDLTTTRVLPRYLGRTITVIGLLLL